MEQQYRFSVVMPVYNKADYLREALDSIFNQTVGFEENIQLILVNDGSTDESPSICLAAKGRYPDNIVYVDRENGGVSAARNEGLGHIAGEVVTFFDADDIWDVNAFQVASDFFSEHGDETDVLVMRLIQFGDITSEHVLDYKFGECGVIDLDKHPDYIQPMIGNCFFRSSALCGLQFNLDLMCGEDTLLVNSILLDKMTCGVSSEAAYWYRKVAADGTASMSRGKERFFSNNLACKLLYSESRKRLGYVARYLKYIGLYELCWQIFIKCDDVFSLEERADWHSDVQGILDPVDEEDICAAPWLTTPKRLALLALKRGERNLSFIPWNEFGAWTSSRDDETALLRLRKLPLVTINLVRISQGQLSVRALTRVSFFAERPDVCVRVHGVGDFPVTLSPFPTYDVVLITRERLLRTSLLFFSLPVDVVLGHDISVVWHDGRGLEHRLPLRFALYGGLPTSKSYLLQDDLIVRHPKLTVLKVVKATPRARASSEYRMLESIVKNSHLGRVEKARIVGLRVAANACRLAKRKPVWIYVDREYKAADSAEALYTYARQQVSPRDANMYFVLTKRSSDYRRLKKMGRVLEPGSVRFRLKFLVADKLLSGHHDALVTNPFGSYGKWLADLFTWRFYDLSHGTLQGDLSSQLNVHVRPIHRFFVSTELEKGLLLSESYGFTEREVCLSGMCRYDLYDRGRTRKKIVFLPTWRASLAGKIIPGTREREYVEGFEDSEYCRALNELINDKALLRAMRENGYEGEFYVHPNYEKQTSCFHGNDVISVGASSADYVRVLSEGALLVTDYSGVSFDFAYMRKPVVYYHFDNLFSGGHSYQGQDFDYDNQGFGPVCKTRDQVVAAICSSLIDGCKMDATYQKRADDFFVFSDKQNCKRVLDVVLHEDD